MCKQKYQVGVFPVTAEGQVVLITSRNTGYWILPKGRTEKGRSDQAVALDEAYEEAGLEGTLKGRYYEFDVVSSRAKKLRLFLMKVKKVNKHYPECNERDRVIVSFDEAAELVQKDLRVVLKQLRKLY
ncbi:MAG: NUDIX hydrolase [Opitutaceae bacterium]